jgi:peptidoglycan/xylan/chitin deacetylase (PgdA/CDA1 family)
MTAAHRKIFLVLLLFLGLGGTSAISVSSFLKSSASAVSSQPSTNQEKPDFMTQAIIDIKKACKNPPTTVASNTAPETAEGTKNLASSTVPPQTVETPTQSAVEAKETNPCISLSDSIGLTPTVTEKKIEPSVPEKSLATLMGFIKPSPPTPQVEEDPKITLPPAAPFGQIHEQAKLASVPILMYHDIVAQKEVFFDVTPEEVEAHFQRIKKEGMTPISPDALLAHLRTGVPLPNKPVLLSFDDGYGGHYQYVYPLLKKYGYPAVFSIYLKKLEGKTKRTSVTWEQLKEMSADPLVTIASHTVTHPKDLRLLTDDELGKEIIETKHILEQKLGIPIRYFTYPEGKFDARVKQWAIAAGYKMAFSMNDLSEGYAGESPDLFSIKRFGQSSIEKAIAKAWGGYPAPLPPDQFNLTSSVEKQEFTLDGTEIVLVSGGKPRTIHADSRYQVQDILKDTGAIGGVDGTFFSLKSLNSNILIGPALSSNRGFVPGNKGENPKLAGRPLALISAKGVRFIPFDPAKHNTLEGIQKESSDGTWISDAFVGGAWLVKNGKASTPESFNDLYGFDANRNRAFWGINQAGQPVVGVTRTMIDSVNLGKMLQKLGYRDAIMVDSGASASVAYKGESQVSYTPRPVPHAIALYPADHAEVSGPNFVQTVAPKK